MESEKWGERAREEEKALKERRFLLASSGSAIVQGQREDVCSSHFLEAVHDSCDL